MLRQNNSHLIDNKSGKKLGGIDLGKNSQRQQRISAKDIR